MRAISSMATRRVLAALAEAAAAAGLPEMKIESVGGVDAARRVAAGEAFDLVFLADDALASLAAAGHVRAETQAPLLVSRVAVAVPDAAVALAERPAGPAFADAAALRAAILAAPAIGYSTGPSGTALVAMLDEWGIGDEARERLVQARPGIPVARLLAEGEVDLGFQQLSELVGEPGIRILGTLPEDCAIDTVFSGAVAAAADDSVAAQALLAFFASDAAGPIVRAHSFSAPPRR